MSTERRNIVTHGEAAWLAGTRAMNKETRNANSIFLLVVFLTAPRRDIAFGLRASVEEQKHGKTASLLLLPVLSSQQLNSRTISKLSYLFLIPLSKICIWFDMYSCF